MTVTSPGDGSSLGGMESAALVVPGRYCGPPDTGNGGYTAGLLAAAMDLSGRPTGPVRVTLRQPPPLDSAMQCSSEDGIDVLACVSDSAAW